jgi:hypothetical protein
MRFQLLSFAAAFLALVVSASALAAGGLAGKYTATISSPAQVKGKWTLTFAKGGVYTVARNGEVGAKGRYSLTATTVTFRAPASTGCGGSGTYTWKKSGSTLRFIRKHESPACQPRAIILAHRFTQVR